MSRRPQLTQAPATYNAQAMQQILNQIADLFAECLRTSGDIRIPENISFTLTADDGSEWSFKPDATGALDTEPY